MPAAGTSSILSINSFSPTLARSNACKQGRLGAGTNRLEVSCTVPERMGQDRKTGTVFESLLYFAKLSERLRKMGLIDWKERVRHALPRVEVRMHASVTHHSQWSQMDNGSPDNGIAQGPDVYRVALMMK